MTDRPLALITGASSGIGAALAAEIAADGYDLMLVARRTDRLHALAETLPTQAQVFSVDLTESGALDALGGILAMLPRAPDVLVNNAGFGRGGPFVDGSPQRDGAMIDLNVRALVDLSHRLLPQMLARRSGGILNVASLAGYQAGPNSAVYAATKAFVISFSDALHSECVGTGVTISALCPGPVETEFFGIAGTGSAASHRLLRPLSAERVAAEGWRGFRRGKRRIVPGLFSKARAATTWMTPAALELPVMKALQKVPKREA